MHLVTANTNQEIPRFVGASHGRQKPRTLGEHLDTHCEDNGRDALEGEEEAPSDICVSVVYECEAER